MNDSNFRSDTSPNRTIGNKGKLIGPKPPLRPGHVWLIRAKLHLEGAHATWLLCPASMGTAAPIPASRVRR